MEKLKDIDFAIIETILAHPDYTPTINAMVFDTITSKNGITYEYFTSRNKAREKMRSITQDEVLEFILNETVKCYNAMAYFYYNDQEILKLNTHEEKLNYLIEVFPDFGLFQKAVSKIANPKLNSVIYYKGLPKELLSLVDSVVKYRYQNSIVMRDYIDKYGYGITYLTTYGGVNLFEKIGKDVKNAAIAKNIQINYAALNKCYADVMSGSQLKNKTNEYGLDGTLYAYQDQGNRGNQEDSLIILIHPENSDFKFLAVSDGMGGAKHGEIASHYTIQELTRWFMNLPADFYYYPLELQKSLNDKIRTISKNLYFEYNEPYKNTQAGATLVAAAITDNHTITSSVGDSRIYSLQKSKLSLLTKDESYVWPIIETPASISKEKLDDLRFHVNNNVITRCIGDNNYNSRIQSSIIENNSYDKLLLFSDGVTDLLSHEQIRVISQTHSADEIAAALVKEAINNPAIRAKGQDELHNAFIKAGKDNASAAIYRRR